MTYHQIIQLRNGASCCLRSGTAADGQAALDNFILNTMVADTQREIIITFGEVIEKHFDDTNAHIMRISNMMYEFALIKGFSYQESELMKVASTMHDIGKIGIPDAIIMKPGKLTDEEFEQIKNHT